MSSRRKIRIIVAFAITLAITPLFFASRKVSAATPTNALTKYEAYGLHMCIVNRFKQSFSVDEIAGNDDYDDFMVGGTKELIKEGLDDNYVSLPAGHGLSGDDSDKISCSKLSSNLIGEGSDNNKNPYSGFTDLLDKFGYEKQESTGKSKCVKYKFQYIPGGESEFYDAGYIEYCESSVNDNGSISSDSIPTAKRYGNEAREDDGGATLHIGYIDVSSSDKVTFCADPQEEDFSAEDCDKYDDDFKGSISRSLSWGEITSGLSNKIKDVYSALGRSAMGDGDSMFDNHTLSSMVWLKYDTYEAVPSGSATSNSGFSYDIKSPLNTFYTAYKNLFGVDYSPYNFDKSQQAALYQNYILSYWEADSKACADTKEASLDIGSHDLLLGDDDDDREYHQTKLYKSDGSAQYCYVKTEKYGDKVYGIEHGLPAGEKIGFAAVAKWLLDNGPDSINPEELVQTPEEESGNRESAEPTCQNQGGAGSLGWIVCSILDWMKSATNGLYKDVVKPSLNIQPELFTEGGEDSGAQKAWGIFRDFANILFIILTLFVIFSQLTGVGIDNYGIKKILPKLIIAAVLINLSYVICLICVDLSNIVGNGIQDLLNGINTTSSVSLMGENIDTGTTDVNGAADVGIVAVSVTAAAIGIVSIYRNPALLLTLFISVLGVFIAVLFIFILLAGRKAAIVLLTVVSPIAFILYMLPNTKKIYDKWFNLWKAMLLVYPICGLLIGGGNFASKLMLTIGNNSEAITAFTAMVVGIVPIFFIPTVIKSAYTALGSIGGTIAGFGGRMRGGATRRLNNSDINRRLQERGQEHRTRVRAGVDRHGNERNLNGFQRFIRGGRRSVARSRAQYVKDQETRSREDSMMGNGFTAALAGAESRVQDDAVKNEEAIIMNDSSLRDDNVALRNGLTTAILNRDSNKIRAYQNILSRKGEKGREHVREAMEDALRSGDVSDTAKRDYASNLINKWGADYKNNNRSTFDYANNVLDGAAATLGANGTKVSSLKQSTLASMDEAELIRTINGASGAELADLQNLAHDALQNETVRNNMKEGTRRELEVLASNSAKAAAAQQSEAQAQAAQQQRDQSMNDLNDQLQQIRAQSQSEIAQDMGQYESAIALAGQPTQKIRVQMRRDGKYINADSGQEIDIGRYRKI